MNDFVSVKQAADEAGVSVSYVGAEIRAGRLPATKIGRAAWAIRGDDLRAWLANPRRGSRSKR